MAPRSGPGWLCTARLDRRAYVSAGCHRWSGGGGGPTGARQACRRLDGSAA